MILGKFTGESLVLNVHILTVLVLRFQFLRWRHGPRRETVKLQVLGYDTEDLT